MASERIRTASRRAQARLWTGPAAHFAGGALDLLGALARYSLVRARTRARAGRRRALAGAKRGAARR